MATVRALLAAGALSHKAHVGENKRHPCSAIVRVGPRDGEQCGVPIDPRHQVCSTHRENVEVARPASTLLLACDAPLSAGRACGVPTRGKYGRCADHLPAPVDAAAALACARQRRDSASAVPPGAAADVIGRALAQLGVAQAHETHVRAAR